MEGRSSLPANKHTGMSIVIHIAGGMAGIPVFYASKALAWIVNHGKPVFTIAPDVEKRLKELFPGMSFDAIKIVYNARLPAHIFRRSIEGMTFRNIIYIAHNCFRRDAESFLLLVHEMVHIRQIREMGELSFVCKYGAQFLMNGGYGAGMPLENEAFQFVSKVKQENYALKE
ncbi:MAG: hypothetical protein JW973_02390 [Bacteroidales bacterium]|nr:hypothetical protein [Bacteroidales bacterium]